MTDKLNPNQVKVLAVLNETAHEESCRSFDAISADTKLDRRDVRLACRSLARKGLLRYAKGLWSEDGEPRGAGYGPTKAGVDHAKTDPKCREAIKAFKVFWA